MLVVRGMSTEVIRHYDEWCADLPWWWRLGCGCSRECSFGAAMLTAYEYKRLTVDGWVAKEGWVIKKRSGRMYIFPWPRNLVKGWRA